MTASTPISGYRKVFACISFFLLMLGSLHSQDTRIGTNNSGQIGPGNICRGSTQNQVYLFALRYIPAGSANLLAINNFTTSGTYVASDITQIQLWTCAFSGCASTTLRATINTSLGPGSHSFTGLNVNIPQSAGPFGGIYFMISVDVAAGAVVGHTFQINLITNTMLSMSVGTTGNEATNNAPGLQTICSPLPIELVSFTGKDEDGMNVLEWTTSSEITNDYFTVEKSTNGIQFYEYKRIPGAGNSNTLLNYSITDEEPSEGITYYRLKQTDFNGDFKYSDMISVKSGPQDNELNIYPNPVNDFLKIHSNLKNVVEIILTDHVGKTIKKINMQNSAVDVSDLQPGLYFLIIKLPEKSFVKQIIKS